MICGLAFALWKSLYGFGGNDEAFYLTIPNRFLMGDAPIKDEWHLSQLSGFLLMPFVWLYNLSHMLLCGLSLHQNSLDLYEHALVHRCVLSLLLGLANHRS